MVLASGAQKRQSFWSRSDAPELALIRSVSYNKPTGLRDRVACKMALTGSSLLTGSCMLSIEDMMDDVSLVQLDDILALPRWTLLRLSASRPQLCCSFSLFSSHWSSSSTSTKRQGSFIFDRTRVSWSDFETLEAIGQLRLCLMKKLHKRRCGRFCQRGSCHTLAASICRRNTMLWTRTQRRQRDKQQMALCSKCFSQVKSDSRREKLFGPRMHLIPPHIKSRGCALSLKSKDYGMWRPKTSWACRILHQSTSWEEHHQRVFSNSELPGVSAGSKTWRFALRNPSVVLRQLHYAPKLRKKQSKLRRAQSTIYFLQAILASQGRKFPKKTGKLRRTVIVAIILWTHLFARMAWQRICVVNRDTHTHTHVHCNAHTHTHTHTW